MFDGVIEIMYFVEDRRAATAWYARLFELPITETGDPEHYFIRVGAQDVWFHRADEKMAAGRAGQVAYWRVQDFDMAVARAGTLGATVYRGPLDREDGEWMCQMTDPFGNLLGLVGPRR
jgi:predicted enzyme related to lactoylglutathione lyase